MSTAKQIREQILAAPDAAPGDQVEWTADDQDWLDRFMLARDAFHAAAGELFTGWDRDNPNRLRLQLEVLHATGLEAGAFNNLMQMGEIQVIREAAKMKLEEREAVIAGLRHGTTPPSAPATSPDLPKLNATDKAAMQPLRATSADGPALHRDDVLILEGLAKRANRAMMQVDLENATLLGRATIGTRLKKLRDANYVRRPGGDRGGEVITEAGLAALSGCAD